MISLEADVQDMLLFPLTVLQCELRRSKFKCWASISCPICLIPVADCALHSINGCLFLPSCRCWYRTLNRMHFWKLSGTGTLHMPIPSANLSDGRLLMERHHKKMSNRVFVARVLMSLYIYSCQLHDERMCCRQYYIMQSC